MIQASFTVTPGSGYVYATEFSFVDTTGPASEIKKNVWDFGDKTDLVYNETKPKHIYQYPGIYKVILTSTSTTGQTSTTSSTVYVDYVYRDYVLFTQIPEKFADPGLKTDLPFKVQVISTQIDKPILLDLYAANSKSIPSEWVPSKWSFLNPTWKFTDSNDTIIRTLSVDGVPLYQNNKIVALTGEAEFYFIDSTSTGNPQENCPVLITCTMQTSSFNYPLESNIYPYPSYANNKNVRGAVIWLVNDPQPDLLKVTSNYINDMTSLYWQDIKIPFMVTAHSNRSYKIPGALSTVSDIIFTYPYNNTTGLFSQVSATIPTLPASAYSVDEAPLYFQLEDKDNFRTGGYIFTTITSQIPATAANIEANTVVPINQEYNSQQFPYAGSFSPNPFVWVSNPEQNTLNKITLVPYPANCPDINFFKENKILIDGFVKQVSVPPYTNNTKFNYTMTGFSGIYGVAIDPRAYDLIACDAELDRIYKFSYTGETLNTFELSSLNDYNSYQKSFYRWRFTTTNDLIVANSYYLNGISFLSTNPDNYIISIGNVIQSPKTYTIDSLDRTLHFTTPITATNIFLDVVEIFNPTLPVNYISSLQSWVSASSNTTTSFLLTGNPSLSSSSNYYIVSIDGILQAPNTYTINNTNKTIDFTSSVPANTTIQALYIPYLNPPAVWSTTLTTQTSTFLLTGDSNYVADQNANFLINIGGAFQTTQNYTYDLTGSQLIFDTLLPTNTPIIITQINIPDSVYIPAAYTPAYVSLDKDYNIWVSLFNTVSVLKLDKDFNLLFNAQPSGISPDSQFDQEFLLKPPVVETDRDSNCWATYAHPLCSLLVKYNSTGDVLAQVNLQSYSVPTDLAVDLYNNIWVSNTYNVLSADGTIQLYSSTSTLLSTITGIPRPGYLALDRNNNLWFTHSINGLGYYNTTTSTLCTWQISATTITPVTSLDFFRTPETYINDENHGGLGVDVYNRVWVIDSYHNTAQIILSATPFFDSTLVRSVKIKPDSLIGYYIDVTTGDTLIESSSVYNYKSAQAAGDWTGNKWYQKYITLSDTPISGISTTFDIHEFVNDNEIRRVNESFNAAEYYKSLAFPEILQNNNILWDKFFGAAVGTATLSTYEDLGQVTYERTANFVSNHADIDTCNIDQLLSLAQEVGVPAADYATALPAEIKRMLDIGSIARNRLWGIPDNHADIVQSLGEELDPFFNTLTAGNKMVLKSKLNNSYTLVNIPLYNSLTAYPLSSFEGYGFAQPVIINYQFFEYIPKYSGKFIENIIDWESTFTTLNSSLSTFNDWYGENGVLENTFNYLLTKNLFLK